MNDSMLQSGRYKISIVRLPPAVVPLNMAMAKGHDIAPRCADTEAEARAECSKLVQDGYVVDSTIWEGVVHVFDLEASKNEHLNAGPSHPPCRRGFWGEAQQVQEKRI